MQPHHAITALTAVVFAFGVGAPALAADTPDARPTAPDGYEATVFTAYRHGVQLFTEAPDQDDYLLGEVDADAVTTFTLPRSSLGDRGGSTWSSSPGGRSPASATGRPPPPRAPGPSSAPGGSGRWR